MVGKAEALLDPTLLRNVQLAAVHPTAAAPFPRGEGHADPLMVMGWGPPEAFTERGAPELVPTPEKSTTLDGWALPGTVS